MQITFFYNGLTKNMVPFMQDTCAEKGIECTVFDTDEDPEIMNDYNVTGMPPAFVVFDDRGHRILTHKGKFDKKKLADILLTLD